MVKNITGKFATTNYRLTVYQQKLLKDENIKGRENIKDHLEKIIRNKILVERRIIDSKKDVIAKQNLYSTQVNYLLNSRIEKNENTYRKYNIANYYFQLALNFNKIAIKRKISRNDLWNIIQKNIIIKKYNKTELRIQKYIFLGEIIPSPKSVAKCLANNDDLPSYLSLIYLDEPITTELEEAYENIKQE